MIGIIGDFTITWQELLSYVEISLGKCDVHHAISHYHNIASARFESLTSGSVAPHARVRVSDVSLLANLDNVHWPALVLFYSPIGLLYCIPSIVALACRRPNAKSIVGLNVLLGWTVIGWVLAFVWSLSDNREEGRRRFPRAHTAP